jgi:predicted unusual protein kinase regulating ubiquinone biosynthesis (AarF/ABC1/UbiB family)
MWTISHFSSRIVVETFSELMTGGSVYWVSRLRELNSFVTFAVSSPDVNVDFGMTLETEETLQFSLLEFVAHLTGEDYNRVPEDLVKLGFLKAERLDTVRASGFLEPLTFMLKQAGQGGGADKVRDRIFAEFREKYPGMEDDELRVQMRSDMKEQIEDSRKRESAVSGITMEVEELQKRNRDAFSIPEW